VIEIEIITDSRFSPADTLIIQADYGRRSSIERWREVSTNYPVLTLRIRNSTMTSNLIRASPFVARNNRSRELYKSSATSRWLKRVKPSG